MRVQNSLLGGSQTPCPSFPEIEVYLKETLHLKNDRLVEKILNQTAANQGIRWKSVLSQFPAECPADLQKMESALKDTLLYQGKGIQVDRSGPDPQIHQIIQYLLGQGKPSVEWFSARNAKGILLREDPELQKSMREEFRVILSACAESFPLPGSKEEILYETFIGNVVALLPYSYPEVGEVFSIPQKIDGEWKKATYSVDKKIDLSPKWFSSPIAAYGLTSQEAPPLLIFLGTTYPAGEGYVATLLSDFTPFTSVGQAPYLYGKKEIQKWLEDKEGVRLCGISLGGAFTFHVLRNHKEKIAQVDAYNPPGLYPWLWKERYNSADIRIIYNENDLVATLGAFPEGDKVRVIRAFVEKSQNFLKAHIQAYSGFDETTLLKSDPVYENRRIVRKVLTALHFVLGGCLVFFPLIFLYFLYSIFNILILKTFTQNKMDAGCV